MMVKNPFFALFSKKKSAKIPRYFPTVTKQIAKVEKSQFLKLASTPKTVNFRKMNIFSYGAPKFGHMGRKGECRGRSGVFVDFRGQI